MLFKNLHDGYICKDNMIILNKKLCFYYFSNPNNVFYYIFLSNNLYFHSIFYLFFFIYLVHLPPFLYPNIA